MRTMDEEPSSDAAQAAEAFWEALADDDDDEIEAWLAPRALEEIGASQGLARRVRDRLGLGPRECANMAILRDVALKGFVDIGPYADAHRIEHIVADLVDDVHDERLVPGLDAASAGVWTLQIVQLDDEWFIDWDERPPS